MRVLRRTMDVLAQIPHCPGLNDALRRNARRAHAALNRLPVREADDITAGPVTNGCPGSEAPSFRTAFLDFEYTA